MMGRRLLPETPPGVGDSQRRIKMKTGKIEGTKKAGENASVTVNDSGRVVVTWDSGEKVEFVSEKAFEAWIGGGNWAGKNPYVESVIW
jgi:hypothetical protein